MNEANNRRRRPALRLYNILFPVCLFYLLPTGVWLLILPANFLIDSAVLHFAMKRQAVPRPKEVWKHSIFRVWSIGFLCDLIGALLILGIELFLDAAQLHWNTFLFPGATLLAPDVAAALTARCPVPTIGVGAGSACDAQYLVLADLLCLGDGPAPKFAKAYAHLADEAVAAISAYRADVAARRFPDAEHAYS